MDDSTKTSDNLSQGFIKLHRSIQKWEWYQHPVVSRVFLHILLNCNHTEKKWQGITIPRGSFVAGRKQLSSSLKISERSIRTALTKLKTTNEVTIKTTNRYSIISASNYEKYHSEMPNETTNDCANKRPTSDQQTTTTKKYKNEKKYIYPEKIQGIVKHFYISKESIENAEYKNQLQKLDLNKSFDAVQKLNTLDGEQVKTIGEVLTWSLTDDFWSKQIISLASLRQKGKNGLTKFFNCKNAMLKSVGYQQNTPSKNLSDEEFEKLQMEAFE